MKGRAMTRPTSCEKAAKELGIPVYALTKAPAGDALKIKPIRVGLYDSYGGSMPAGWTKWLFEQYEMPFQVVYPAMLDAGWPRPSAGSPARACRYGSRSPCTPPTMSCAMSLSR